VLHGDAPPAPNRTDITFLLPVLPKSGEFIMAKCDICGRGPQFGNHVSFSQRHVKRRFNANIQKRKVLINGKVRRVHICTSCLKTLSKTA
jgi:large subunit ribosomal protein L28